MFCKPEGLFGPHSMDEIAYTKPRDKIFYSARSQGHQEIKKSRPNVMVYIEKKNSSSGTELLSRNLWPGLGKLPIQPSRLKSKSFICS